MHILIAPNAFKNSLTATEAARAIELGLQRSKLSCTTECFGIGDGGDGSGDLLIEKFNGSKVGVTVRDALGRSVFANFGLIDNGQTAVIEMANASGLRLLVRSELQPLIATSFGTGQLIRHALDEGVTKIIVTLGGSATVDGGTGILKALGAKFLDDKGEELEMLPKDLVLISSIDTTGLDARLMETEIVVMCDVLNVLIGAEGAAAVFGPQKGASMDDVLILDQALTRFAEVVKMQLDIAIDNLPMGGSAGGTAAGLYALLNAKLVNGIEYFLDSTGFDQSLAKADLFITGEGSIDRQTLQGKAPFGAAVRAKLSNIPVIAMAGKVPIVPDELLHEVFEVLLPITPEPLDLETALKTTFKNLERTAFELGNLLTLSK